LLKVRLIYFLEQNNMIEKINTYKELAERAGVTPMTIRRWVEQEIIPPPLQIGPRRVGWPETQVQEFFQSRKPVKNSDK
jgi:predicted DNA-binding transcriptional regulator AlpA